MIHAIALIALLAMAQTALAIDRRDVNIFEVRNICLKQNGFPSLSVFCRLSLAK